MQQGDCVIERGPIGLIQPKYRPLLVTNEWQEREMARSSPDDMTIVRAAIHPAIGIGRIGNSRDAFFYGPEVSYPKPEPPGFYRDASGALKRQAARFRIYGYNAAGEVVAELTQANAGIAWSAHLANAKATWYQFQLAMDIPEVAEAKP